jgi:hypothetical protein
MCHEMLQPVNTQAGGGGGLPQLDSTIIPHDLKHLNKPAYLPAYPTTNCIVRKKSEEVL